MGFFEVILLWALAALLLLLAVFLIFPISYKLAGGYRKTFFFHPQIQIKPFIELSGDFGKEVSCFSLIILGIPFKFHPQKPEKKEKALKGGDKKKGGRKRGKRGPGLDFATFVDKEFIQNGLAFLLDILKMVGPESLEIRGKVGFEDPCCNGCLAALNRLFRTILSTPKVKIDLEPVWEEECTDVAFSISGEITIILLLVRAAKFLLNGGARKIWKAVWAGKRKAKLAV